MLKSSFQENDNAEEIDQAKFDEYLRLLKDFEEEESRQKNTQPLLRNSFDSDSSNGNAVSNQDKLAKDQDEYAEYMRRLYDIDIDEYKMNGGKNLRSGQNEHTDFKRSIYDQFESDDIDPQ